MNDLIVNTSDWNPISWIPSTNSATWKKFVKTHGVGGKISGCYQVALTKDIESIGDDIVHATIGYNGKAKDVISRTGGIRAPKGRHGTRLYIDKNNLSRETDVVVRYLITADADKATELENFLHKESELAFGARFAWREASGGIDGKYDNILSEVEYLTAAQMLDLLGDIMELSKQKALQEHEELILRKIESV